jgi:uncharacterized membrane protein
MHEWLVYLTEKAILLIDAMALVIILIGTIQAFITGMLMMLGSPTGHERREVWLRFARWLVAALSFQLAADIIETSITESWQSVGRLAAIAVIRTFLNYFLEKDLDDTRERQRETKQAASPAPSGLDKMTSPPP